jgi:acyl-coenzyme A thioesterase PaaI-like protein
MTENAPQRPPHAPKDDAYEHHGGFPKYTAAVEAPEAFGEFVAEMRRVQDLAVSIDAPDDVVEKARSLAQELSALLTPYEAPEGVGPAGRLPRLPGRGSLLMLPWTWEKMGPEGVRSTGMFTRYHLGGNAAVHGGVLPLLFDDLFGVIVHASGRPISRTAYLHINYRAVTPLYTPLVVEGQLDRVDGRKGFVSAKLTDTSGKLLADCDALMVQLLPHQP